MKTFKLNFILFVFSLIFTGCVNNQDDSGAADPGSILYDPTAVIITVDDDELTADSSTNFYASGGTPPYLFSLETGNGTLDPFAGTFTPNLAYRGTVTVRATDSKGRYSSLNITILDPLEVNPNSDVIFTQTSTTLNITGGKPPYRIIQVTGGGTLTKTATSVSVLAGSDEDQIKLDIIDALFNRVAATIVVVAPLSVVAERSIQSAVQADGSANPMYFDIFGGMPDALGEFTVNKINGDGTVYRVSARRYYFEPDPTQEQVNSDEVEIQVLDSNGGDSRVKFSFIIPMKLAVGSMHSCAMNRRFSSGDVKCWGDGIHGQLGYGDDPNSQPAWGDCEDCNENANVLNPNGGAFRKVEFLTSSEKASGGYIMDFSYGSDLLCAIVALNSGATSRTVRCFGNNSSTSVDVSFFSRIAEGTQLFPRFPFKNERHPSIDPTSNLKVVTPQKLSYSYRVAVADSFMLRAISTGQNFPRPFNPLGTSTSYQPQTPHHMGTFGLLATDPTDLSYKFTNPSGFVFFDSTFKDTNWNPSKIYLSEFGTSSGRIYVLNNSNEMIASNLSYGSSYSQNYPFITSSNRPGNDTLINTASGIRFKNLSIGTYGTECFVGSNNRAYCMGTNAINVTDGNGLLGGGSTFPEDWNTRGTAYLPVLLKDRDQLAPDLDGIDILDGGGSADLSASEASQIAVGGDFNRCALFKGSTVVQGSNSIAMGSNVVGCWGRKHSGNLLGQGLQTTGVVPYAKPVLIEDGTAANNADNPILNDVVYLTGNQRRACAIRSNGDLYCWGSANNGSLTEGKAGNYLTASLVNLGGQVLDISFDDDNAACAIVDNGTKKLKCWGTVDLDHYGIPKSHSGHALLNLSEFNLSEAPAKVDIGGSGGCVLPASPNNAFLRCWGDNRSGVLGIGNGVRGNKPGDMDNLQNVNLGTGLTAKAIAAGHEHSCAIIQENNRVKCWGSNAFGELGQPALNVGFGYTFGASTHRSADHKGLNPNQMGDNLNYISFGSSDTAKLIASGGDHVCLATLDDEIYCWGDNTSGQVGINSTSPVVKTPSKVTLKNEGNITIKQLALGFDHSCVLVDDSTVGDEGIKIYCWGSNLQGQLGYGDLSTTYSSGDHTNGIIGDQVSDIPVANLDPIYFGGKTPKQISANGLNTCVVFSNGTGRCFGPHDVGQVGIGTYDNDANLVNDHVGDDEAEKGYKLLLNMGTNYSTGLAHKIISISVGVDFACAVLEDQRVKCWGGNRIGQLGVQDSQDRGKSNGEMGDALPYVNIEPGEGVVELAVGNTHSCAVLSNNKVKCWGANFSGQLGFDADYARGAFPFTMGNSLPYCKISF